MDEPTTETPVSRISFEIPSSVLRNISKAIIAFSYFEATVEMAIWNILKLESDDGRIFTRTMQAVRKIGILQEVVERRHTNLTRSILDKDFWKRAKDAAQERNIAAHGVWIWFDQKTSAVVSLRWMDQPNTITAEMFPISRLRLLARDSTILDSMLRSCLADLKVPPPPFAPPPHKMSTTLVINHTLEQS